MLNRNKEFKKKVLKVEKYVLLDVNYSVDLSLTLQ